MVGHPVTYAQISNCYQDKTGPQLASAKAPGKEMGTHDGFGQMFLQNGSGEVYQIPLGTDIPGPLDILIQNLQPWKGEINFY